MNDHVRRFAAEQLFRLHLLLGRHMRTTTDPFGPTWAHLQDRPLVIRFAPRGTA